MSQRTFVVAIAIENHKSKFFPSIGFATNDAEGFVSCWKAICGIHCESTLLSGDDASRTQILSELDRIVDLILPSDRLVVLFVGHALSSDGVEYLVVCDTKPTALAKTGIVVSEVVSRMKNANCEQVLLFMDVRHDGFVGAQLQELDCDDFVGEAFATELSCATGRHVFLSCSFGESSYASPQTRHRIWLESVIRALSGQSKDCFESPAKITVQSLQKYLEDEVPRQLRVTIAGKVSQTPNYMGDSQRVSLVADLSQMADPGAIAGVAPESSIKEMILSGIKRGRVKELSGFVKPKVQLSTCNDWERNFVESAGSGDVSTQSAELFEQLRDLFRYKRKDLSYSCAGATATIKGPDFDVNISLTQDDEAAQYYVMQTEVRSIRSIDMLDDPRFIAAFTKHCKKIVFELEGSIDIESTIDDIESVDLLIKYLEYDPDCSYFTLRLPDVGVLLHATSRQMTFSLDGHGDLKALLQKTRSTIDRLAGDAITLGLSIRR